MLAGLWWTGCLWDLVDWPACQEAGCGVSEPSVTLRITGVESFGRWQDVSDDFALLADGGQARSWGSVIHGDRMTLVLSPVRDPGEFARKIDFATVHRIHGRVITVGLRGPEPDPVTKALSGLNSDDPPRRRAAARRLARLRPDGRREQVARALAARLNDAGETAREEVVEALGVWGTAESLTPLLKALDEEDTRRAAIKALRRLHKAGLLPEDRRAEVARALEAQLKDRHAFYRREVIAALGQLKDEGSAEPLAQCLENLGDSQAASAALCALGPAAEKAVARRLQDRNFLVRSAACEVLAEIGTRESVPALKALRNDLHSGDDAEKALRAIAARHGAEGGD